MLQVPYQYTHPKSSNTVSVLYIISASTGQLWHWTLACVVIKNHRFLHDLWPTCQIIERPDRAREFHIVSGSRWAIMTHRASGSVVIQYHRLHSVVTEVSHGALFAWTLTYFILVGSIFTAGRIGRAIHTIMANSTSEIKSVLINMLNIILLHFDI